MSMCEYCGRVGGVYHEQQCDAPIGYVVPKGGSYDERKVMPTEAMKRPQALQHISGHILAPAAQGHYYARPEADALFDAMEKRDAMRVERIRELERLLGKVPHRFLSCELSEEIVDALNTERTQEGD